MKRLIIVLCCFIPLSVFGQMGGGCHYTASQLYQGIVDSTDFSGNQNSSFNLEIDTSFVNNLWQVGTSSKVGFPSLVYGNKAIQTDTMNSYDTSNVSVFNVWSDTNYSVMSGFDSIHALTFWHYYNVDSLSDSCIVQLTLDSGNTWLNYADYTALQQQNYLLWLAYNYSTPWQLSPDNSGKFLWTGRSSGWEKVQICFNYPLPIKPSRGIPPKYGFRFIFKSDSIQNNKPGWIIDKIGFQYPIMYTGTNDFKKGVLNIYPNPSQDGVFFIDFPSSYVSGQLIVYNYLGRIVQERPLKERIDLSSLKAGMYFYRAVFIETNQWFSGQLEIN
jgi:hypothetical protein